MISLINTQVWKFQGLKVSQLPFISIRIKENFSIFKISEKVFKIIFLIKSNNEQSIVIRINYLNVRESLGLSYPPIETVGRRKSAVGVC